MSARYWELESSVDNWALEDGTGARLLEDATLTTVSNTFTIKYDIRTFVSKVFSYLYDITANISKMFSYLYDINDTGSEVLAEQKGTITSTILGSLNNEVCFLTKTDGPRHYSLYLFIDNMASGDKIEFKTEIQDPISLTWKKYETNIVSYNDIGGKISAFQVFLPARAIRFCLTQTLGTLRSYNWVLYKAT